MSEKGDSDRGVEQTEFDEPFHGGEFREARRRDVDALEDEVDRLETELYRIRGELSRFEQAVDDRTVDKPDLERELRRYVRRRMRRSRARGWGPYLVLLYGTAMTVGAFYYLAGGWAILAMFVIWLSTLGLYVLMLGAGLVFTLLGLPSRARDAIARRRS